MFTARMPQPALRHILYIVPFQPEFSGADRDFFHIFNRLPDKYRLTVVSPSDVGSLRAHLSVDTHSRVISVPFPVYPYMLAQHQRDRVSPIRYARFIRWLYKENRKAADQLHACLANDRVDLVHSWVSTILLGAIFARNAGCRHVWHTRETLFAETYKQRIWLWLMHRYSDAILAPTESTARHYGPKALALNDGAPIEQLRGEYEAAAPPAAGEWVNSPSGTLTICQTGVLHIHKGQLQLVEAIALLRSRRPDIKIRAFLLGKVIDPNYLCLLEKAISSNGLKGSVYIMGYRFDYLSFLKIADVIVQPSPLPDPYPNAVRDAMIVGKPVIAAGSGGIPDMITDGRDGLLVAPGDADELSKAIEHLYDNSSLRIALGKQAYLNSAVKFNVEQTAAKLDSLYSELLHLMPDEGRGRSID
jgi:glycosyltransferase involved in cell wall biosynthesis